MLIRRGTHVAISSGPYEGCFGIVRDMAYFEDQGSTVVDVEFWCGRSGRFLKSVFEVHQVARRRVMPIQKEAFELMALGGIDQ